MVRKITIDSVSMETLPESLPRLHGTSTSKRVEVLDMTHDLLAVIYIGSLDTDGRLMRVCNTRDGEAQARYAAQAAVPMLPPSRLPIVAVERARIGQQRHHSSHNNNI